MRQPRRQHKRRNSVLGAAFSVLLLCGFLLLTGEPAGQPPADSTESAAESISASAEAHILDVGQGLSVFIRAGDSCLLYDGGGGSASSFVISYLQRHDVKELDYVIVSHYDADHLSGIVGAVNAFPVGTLIAPDYETDSDIFDSFQSAVRDKGLTVTSPVPGTEYPLGEGSFEILAPLGSEYEDENDYSVVVKISMGNNSLLLTGDASAESELEMLEAGSDLTSDICIVGHHGSAGSTQEAFLTAVAPAYAVVSCGLGNDYGHPAQRVTELLETEHIPLFRTDLQETIDIFMTEEELSFAQKPCNDYTPGSRIALDGSDFHAGDYTYVLNTRSHRFHLPDCESVAEMSVKNRRGSYQTREELILEGYDPCGSCKP